MVNRPGIVVDAREDWSPTIQLIHPNKTLSGKDFDLSQTLFARAGEPFAKYQGIEATRTAQSIDRRWP